MSAGRPTETGRTGVFGLEPPDINYLSINNQILAILSSHIDKRGRCASHRSDELAGLQKVVDDENRNVVSLNAPPNRSLQLAIAAGLRKSI
jgi:hypothetical protein